MKVFKTKTGFCHVTADEIILTRDGVIGNISQVVVGNRIARIITIYGFLSLGLIYFSYSSYKNGDMIATLLFGIFGLYLAYGIIRSRNNSASPVIPRKDIQRVKYNAGIPFLTRPRFEIEFNENSRLKTRLIILPGTSDGGKTETNKALQIMYDEKLLTSPSL